MAGYISFFNLDDWFTSTFSKEEQIFMNEKYAIGGIGSTPLFFGEDAIGYNGTPAYFLASLSDWFNTKALYPICLRIIRKTEELFEEDQETAEDKHFYFLHLIKFYYKNRDINNNLDKSIIYCKKQRAISSEAAKMMMNNPMLSMINLPNHTGFEKLAIIEKKNKNWENVIRICKQAKQEKWSGEWDK